LQSRECGPIKEEVGISISRQMEKHDVYINITIGRTPASWSDTSDNFNCLNLIFTVSAQLASTTCEDK
jgi:hypothetical protein